MSLRLMLASMVALTALAGCTIDHGASPNPSAESAPIGSGPYAAEFGEALGHVTSPVEKKILSDGVITSQENAEVQSNVRRCLADSGYAITFRLEGGFSVKPLKGGFSEKDAGHLDDRVNACEKANDNRTTALYQQIRANPKKIDDRPAIVSCLKRESLVPKTYALSDYNRQNVDDTFPFSMIEPKAAACFHDPFDLYLKQGK